MKQLLQAYGITISIIIMLSILVSLIFGTLFFFHITDTTITTIAVWLFGILMYFIAGILFGHYTNKKILIHILVISIIMLTMYFIFFPIESFSLIRIACKILAFAIATILMQNKKGFT